jgi:hypothetical protein
LVDAGSDAVTSYLKSQIENSDLKKETKALFIYVIDNSSALASFGIEYARQKARGKVDANALMKDFLASKGKSLADFGISVVDSEVLSDAWAVLSLIKDVKDSAKYSSIPVVGVALTIGFLINDAADFLVNFTPAQRAYYELFLHKSRSKLPYEVPRMGTPKY